MNNFTIVDNGLSNVWLGQQLQCKKLAFGMSLVMVSATVSPLMADDQYTAEPSPVTQAIVQPAALDDNEIYECWLKEQQMALGAHKACGELDSVREVRNAIAEASIDEKTKKALLAAFDKRMIVLEKKAVEKKNSLAAYRKQVRDDAFIFLAFFIPAIIAISVLSAVASANARH